MSRSGSPGPRIEGEPAYVLHARAFRETSQLLEVFSAGHGRMGLLARGAKGGKGGGRAALLQPFTPLIVSWQGRGELPQLVDVEPAGQLNECSRSHCWYEPVATEVEGVSQFCGTPINASTNRGFRSTFGEPG